MPGWRTGACDGAETVVLDNGAIRVTVVPRLGGRIWSVVDGDSGAERLWRRPGASLASAPRGASYDDWFAGGWDDIFPSDGPGTAGGYDLPDHGEWWTEPAAWSVTERPGGPVLTLSGAGWRTPHRWTRTLSLIPGRPALRLSTLIVHTGTAADGPLPFLWRIHPALPALPGGRIHLPAATVLADGAFSTGLATGRCPWPDAPDLDGRIRDLSRIPGRGEGGRLLLYADHLTAGWCAVTGPDGAGLGFAFDRATIDTITLFADFGGWRGLQAIIPEPGAGFPAETGGVIAGESRRPVLRPGEAIRFDITAVAIAPGPGGIAAIGRDGGVIRAGG
ncbi:MAG: hypothetical protein ACKOWF_17000 [Chloroflexota bacterium]